MTSKLLFFKAMKEDMRHRGWMIALSALGSFLALPVAWLLYVNNLRMESMGSYEKYIRQADHIVEVTEAFWRHTANYLVGFMIIGGALVAALAGFRFVFHKNQVDTWHSLPIKRGMLFWVCYVNGCIVWLFPLVICTVLTAVLSGGLALGEQVEGVLAGAGCFYEVLKFAAGNFALWTVVFLLVYDMTLLAMMFSGNVLNTMVSMLIMGVGGACFYMLGVQLYEFYFDTFFYLGSGNAICALYASPFVSAVTLLLERGGEIEGYSAGVNLLIAAVLAVCAWLLYRRRPSELAEQGIRNRGFSTVLRFVTALGAGVGGWLILGAITNGSIMWCFFGAFLAAVLVHGVLDVVFGMDFRAFFAHRLQMAGTVAAVLLVCFAFYGDWFGYDSYLPKKEQIAGIGVRIESLSNRTMWMGLYPLETMGYQDTETAYAFLQKMAEEPDEERTGSEGVDVCVTLKNGRTYYRRYHVSKRERELIMPIVLSEEYLKCAYCLNESVAESHEVTLQPVQGNVYYAEKKFAMGELSGLLRAYNQDVLETPETVLLGEDRVLAGINLSFRRTDGYWVTAELSIYESMKRTIEALKALGYEELVTPWKAEEITSVNFSVDDFGLYKTAEDIVEAARMRYGVYREENPGEQAEGVQTTEQTVSGAVMDYADQSITAERRKDLTLYITDQEEIEELLALISRDDGYKRWGVFKRSFVTISITDREGETVTCYIKRGDLPEKYLQRFGELMQSIEE